VVSDVEGIAQAATAFLAIEFHIGNFAWITFEGERSFRTFLPVEPHYHPPSTTYIFYDIGT
jgi:hypothetical protein